MKIMFYFLLGITLGQSSLCIATAAYNNTGGAGAPCDISSEEIMLNGRRSIGTNTDDRLPTVDSGVQGFISRLSIGGHDCLACFSFQDTKEFSPEAYVPILTEAKIVITKVAGDLPGIPALLAHCAIFFEALATDCATVCRGLGLDEAILMRLSRHATIQAIQELIAASKIVEPQTEDRD